MGNTITSVYNKIQYEMHRQLSDPEAESYARQQVLQAEQDKAAAKRRAMSEAEREEQDKKDAENKVAAANLAKRSKFSSLGELVEQISNSTLAIFTSLLVICLVLYAGSLSANKAIGYHVPFRILSFFYGMIFFPFVYITSLYDTYYRGITSPYYGFLPIYNYTPNGWAERIFLGLISYEKDDQVVKAAEHVKELYHAAAGASAVVSSIASASSSTAPSQAPSPAPSVPAAPSPTQVPKPILNLPSLNTNVPIVTPPNHSQLVPAGKLPELSSRETTPVSSPKLTSAPAPSPATVSPATPASVVSPATPATVSPASPIQSKTA